MSRNSITPGQELENALFTLHSGGGELPRKNRAVKLELPGVLPSGELFLSPCVLNA